MPKSDLTQPENVYRVKEFDTALYDEEEIKISKFRNLCFAGLHNLQ